MPITKSGKTSRLWTAVRLPRLYEKERAIASNTRVQFLTWSMYNSNFTFDQSFIVFFWCLYPWLLKWACVLSCNRRKIIFFIIMIWWWWWWWWWWWCVLLYLIELVAFFRGFGAHFGKVCCLTSFSFGAAYGKLGV